MSAPPRERCAADRCTRWAREDGFCARHNRPQYADRDPDDEQRERRRIFETRLQSGDYRALFGELPSETSCVGGRTAVAERR